MPLISIIIPTFNSSNYIKKTIESILNQSFSDYEIIIIDDCSTDQTSSVISYFGDSRIRYVQLASNHGGPSRPRNIGIAESIGEYICLFDSDDVMLPSKIEISLSALNENHGCGMVFTDAYRINESGALFSGTLLQDYTGLHSVINNNHASDVSVISSNDAFSLLFEENYIPTSSVILRRSILDQIGFFDESLKNGDDRDMWYRLTRYCDICFVNRPLHQYRVRTGSVSSRGIQAANNRIMVVKKQLTASLPNDLKKKAKILVAKNYAGIGYAFRSEGELKKARENYINSLKYNFRFRTTLGFIAATLHPQVLKSLKALLQRG